MSRIFFRRFFDIRSFSLILGLFALSLEILLFWPGGISVDTMEQYSQAESGTFSDWHPPMMAFLWRLSEQFLKGASGFFIFQTGLLFAAYFLFWRFVYSVSKRLSLFIPLVSVLPITIGLSGMLWKDTFLVSVSLFFMALVLTNKPVSTSRILFSCLVFFVALSVRHNGVLLVFPGAFVLADLALARLNLKPSQKITSSLCLGFF